MRKTNRLLIVEESPAFAAVGAEIATRAQEACFDDLDAPIQRVSAEFIPVPYAEHLEQAALPSSAKIIAMVKKLLHREEG